MSALLAVLTPEPVTENVPDPFISPVYLGAKTPFDITPSGAVSVIELALVNVGEPVPALIYASAVISPTVMSLVVVAPLPVTLSNVSV